MKKISLVLCGLGMTSVVSAGLYGDTPDAKHAWAVHDLNRPNPVKIEPAAQVGQPPSDARVLFDGTKESFARNWCDSKGKPSQWKLGTEGDFYSVPEWKNGGAIFTRDHFGDCQLHLEYRHDASLGIVPSGRGAQMHGNSGVFLMGNYEIQVLESYGTNPADMKNPNYADGQAGAVYAENPPQVNPARQPGEWQVYDIVFHQPKWDGKKLLHPGSVTVFFNGVLVQDHWEMEGLTTHCRRRPLAPHAPKGPLSFQDHGCTVHFRNVWIREIPSRWDNTTHSSLSGVTADVMALRHQTAQKLLAKIDQAKCEAQQVLAAYEVVSYSKEKDVLEPCQKIVMGYLKKLEVMDSATLDANRDSICAIKKATDVLLRNHVFESCPLATKVAEIVSQKGWNKMLEPKKLGGYTIFGL